MSPSNNGLAYQEACPSDCSGCPKYSQCTEFITDLTYLINVADLQIQSQKFLEKVALHLKRQGLNYPQVENYRTCWLHDKVGVFSYYQRIVGQVKETMK